MLRFEKRDRALHGALIAGKLRRRGQHGSFLEAERPRPFQDLPRLEDRRRLLGDGVAGRIPGKTPGTRQTDGTRQTRRLEQDDYQGHSLAMLRRIAAALGKRVEIRFLPLVAAQASGV